MSTNSGVSACGSMENIDMWLEAEGWAELIQLNRNFLRGETNCTPYYAAPIDDETVPSATDLLKMHDYGLLTFESQPARVEGPGRTARAAYCPEHRFVHSKQKAFLSFLVPAGPLGKDAELAKAFRDALLAEPTVFTSVFEYDGFCKHDCCIKSPKLKSNFPAEWQTHMRAYASTRAKLLKQELKPYTHIDLSCNSILFCFRQNELMAAMRPLVVNVLAKNWEDINIAKLVADIAEKSGLESTYLDDTADMKDADEEEEDETEIVDDDEIEKKK